MDLTFTEKHPALRAAPKAPLELQLDTFGADHTFKGQLSAGDFHRAQTPHPAAQPHVQPTSKLGLTESRAHPAPTPFAVSHSPNTNADGQNYFLIPQLQLKQIVTTDL